MTPMRLRILGVAFWLGVAAMGAVYLTSPAIGPMWSRQLGPWYRAAADLARGESGAGRIAARHARQAILTWESLPAGAAEKNGEWFGRWDQNYLNYQRGEFAKLKSQVSNNDSVFMIDLSAAFESGRAKLSDGEITGGEGLPFEITATDRTRLEINLAEPISPREFQWVNFGLIPIHSESAGGSICSADEHIRVIWFSEDRGAPFSEEQSAIAAIGAACGDEGGLMIDLSRRYDWLSLGKVDRLWILFRAPGEPLRFKIKSE